MATERLQPIIALQIGFDDGIVLGGLIAGQLREASLPADALAALRRVYDELAKAGMRDWHHDGIARDD